MRKVAKAYIPCMAYTQYQSLGLGSGQIYVKKSFKVVLELPFFPLKTMIEFCELTLC